MITIIASFVFWVACAALFKIIIITKFCFPGGVHNYFLIITTIASAVFVEWCARLFLITTTMVSCVPSGGVRGYFFKYYYYREYVFFGWCARLFVNYNHNCEFCLFSGGVRCYF